MSMESIFGKTLIITSILVGISEGLSNGKHLPSLVREKRLDPLDEEPTTNEPVDIKTLNSDESNDNLIENKYKRTNIENKQKTEEKESSSKTAKEITSETRKDRNSDKSTDNKIENKTKNTGRERTKEEKIVSHTQRTKENHDQKGKSEHSDDSKNKQVKNKSNRTNLENKRFNAENDKTSLQHQENNSKDIAESKDTDKDNGLEILNTKLHSEEEKFIDSLKHMSRKHHHQFPGKGQDEPFLPGKKLSSVSQKTRTVQHSDPREDLRHRFRHHLKRKIRRRLRVSRLSKKTMNTPHNKDRDDISLVSLSDLKEAVKSSSTRGNEDTPETADNYEQKIMARPTKGNKKLSVESSPTRARDAIPNIRTRLGRMTISPTAKANQSFPVAPDLTIRIKDDTPKKKVSGSKDIENKARKDNIPVSSDELKKAAELSSAVMSEGFAKKKSLISSSRTSRLPKNFSSIIGTSTKTPRLSSLPKLSNSQRSPTGNSYIPLKGNKKAGHLIKPTLRRRKRLSRHKKHILDSSMKLSSTLRFTFSTPFDREVRSRSSVNQPTESTVVKPSVRPLVMPKLPSSPASLPDFLPSLKKIPSDDLMMLNDFFNHAAAFKEKQMKRGSAPTKRQAQIARSSSLREKELEQLGSDSWKGNYDTKYSANDDLYHSNHVKEIRGHQIQEENGHQLDNTNVQHSNYHGHHLNENQHNALNDNRKGLYRNNQGYRVENHDSVFEESSKNPNNLVHQSKDSRDSSHVELQRNTTEGNDSKTKEFQNAQGKSNSQRKMDSNLYAKELLEFQRKAIEAEEKRLDDEIERKEQVHQVNFNSNQSRLQEPISQKNAKQNESYRIKQGPDTDMTENKFPKEHAHQMSTNPNEVTPQPNTAKEHKVHELLEEMGRKWKESHQTKALNRVNSQHRIADNSQETKVHDKDDSADHRKEHQQFDLFDALRQITKHPQNVSTEIHSSRWNLEKLNNQNNSDEHNDDDSNYLTGENDNRDQNLNTNDQSNQNGQNKKGDVNNEKEGETRKQSMKRHRRKMLRASEGPTVSAHEPTTSLPKDSDDDDDEVVEMAFTPSANPFIPTTPTPIGNNYDDKSVEFEVVGNGKALPNGNPIANKTRDISKSTNTIQRSYWGLTGQQQGTKPKDSSTNGDLVIYDSDDDDDDGGKDVETVESIETPSDGNNVKINTTVQAIGAKKVNATRIAYNLFGLNANSEDDIQNDKLSYQNNKDRNNDIETIIGKNESDKAGQPADGDMNGGRDTSTNLNNNNNNNDNDKEKNNEEDIPRDNRLLYILGDPEQIIKKEESRKKIEDMVDKVQLNRNQIQGNRQQPILNRDLRAKLKAMEIRVLEAHQKVSKDLEEIERHLTEKYETLKNSISQAKTLTKTMDNKINDTVLHVLKLAKTSADTAKSKVRLVLKAATALTDIEKHMGANETRNIARVIKSRIAELPASKYRAYQRILDMNKMIAKMDGAKIIAESKANSTFTGRDQVERNMADIATNVLDELTSTEEELNKDTRVEIEDEKEAEKKLEDAERRNYMVAIKSGEALKKIEGYLERLENEEKKLHNTNN